MVQRPQLLNVFLNWLMSGGRVWNRCLSHSRKVGLFAPLSLLPVLILSLTASFKASLWINTKYRGHFLYRWHRVNLLKAESTSVQLLARGMKQTAPDRHAHVITKGPVHTTQEKYFLSPLRRRNFKTQQSSSSFDLR